MEYRTREKNDKFLNSICRKNRRITDYRIPSFPSSSRPCSILFAFFTFFKVSIRARADSHNSSPALLCGVHFGRKGNGRKRRTKQKRRLHGQTFVIQIPKQIATRWMSKSCIQPRRSKSDQKNLLPLSHNLYISFKILSEHTIDALY